MCKPGSKWSVGVEVCACHAGGPSREMDKKTFPGKHKRYVQFKALYVEGTLGFN